MKVLTTTEIMIDLLEDEIKLINHQLTLLKVGVADDFERTDLLRECGTKTPTIRLLERFGKTSFVNTSDCLSALELRRRLAKNIIIQLKTDMKYFEISVNNYRNQITIGEDLFTVGNESGTHLITKKYRNFIYVLSDNIFKYQNMISECFGDEDLINSLEWLVLDLFN